MENLPDILIFKIISYTKYNSSNYLFIEYCSISKQFNNVLKKILMSHRLFFNNLWKQIKSNPINDYLLSYDHITQTFFNKNVLKPCLKYKASVTEIQKHLNSIQFFRYFCVPKGTFIISIYESDKKYIDSNKKQLKSVLKNFFKKVKFFQSRYNSFAEIICWDPQPNQLTLNIH